MNNANLHYIRNNNGMVSRNGMVPQIVENAELDYNGDCEPYEDIADYIPHGTTLQGTVIA